MGLRIARRGVKRKLLISVSLFALALQPLLTVYPPSAHALSETITVTPSSWTVDQGETKVSTANASDHTGLVLTFDHVAEKLEPNKQLKYGWKVGGVGTQLGVIEGATNTGGNPGVGENGSKSVVLPDEAATSDLELYFTNTGSAGNGNDAVQISNIALNGEIVAAPPAPDTTNPTITYVTPTADGQRLNPTNTIKVDFADDVALKQTTVHGYINNVAVPSLWQHPLVDTTTHTIELPLTGLAEGTYQIRAAVTDQAGNASQINRTFILDSTLPTISIKTGAGTADGSNSANGAYNRISFKLHDANGKLKEVILNGYSYARSGSWNDLNWQNIVKSHLVEEGVNTIYAVDAAGNTSTTLTFVYDKTGPTITVKDESVGDQSLKTYSNVSFKLYDAHQVDKVTINGVVKDLTNNTWSDVNGVKPGVFGAVEGQNTLVAYDALGNTTTYEFTIDWTAPSSFTLVTPENETTMTSSEFTRLDWTDATDNSGAVKYEVLLYKDGEWIPSSGQITDSEWTPSAPLAEGVYGWKVWAVDAAGNVMWNEDGGRTFTINNPDTPDDGEENTPPGEDDGTVDTPDETETPIEQVDDDEPQDVDTFADLVPTPSTLGVSRAITSFITGNNTDDNATTQVLGTSDEDESKTTTPLKDTANVLGSETTNGGAAWWLWLLVLAAVVAGWWFITATRRKKKE